MSLVISRRDDDMNFFDLRRSYHKELCKQVLALRAGVPNNADKDSKRSVEIADGVVRRIGLKVSSRPPTEQRVGKLFEEVTLKYLEGAFGLLQHLRPGEWMFSVHSALTEFEQYEHLSQLNEVLRQHRSLRATLGNYLVKPDIVIGRAPVPDEEISRSGSALGSAVASLTPLRAHNNAQPILHASISCKWTFRSDRAQNARTEGLNLIRNRKGNTPHIAIVTAEPLPNRIASLALGTGDLDCVYHIALNELRQAVADIEDGTFQETLDLLVEGKRLRDISDLPFDLAI
jgi:hypothetical protein